MQCWEALHPKKGATVPATPFCNVELRMRNLIAEAADGEPVLLGVVGLVHAGVVGERAHICRNGRSVGQIIVIAAGGHWGEGTLESILGCIGQLGVNNICDAVGYAVTQGRFLNAVLQIGYIRLQIGHIGLRCLCLRVNGRGFRAVEDIHDHFDSLVGHQLVLGVAHHGLVADFVVLREDCCHAA